MRREKSLLIGLGANTFLVERIVWVRSYGLRGIEKVMNECVLVGITQRGRKFAATRHQEGFLDDLTSMRYPLGVRVGPARQKPSNLVRSERKQR